MYFCAIYIQHDLYIFIYNTRYIIHKTILSNVLYIVYNNGRINTQLYNKNFTIYLYFFYFQQSI